MAFPAWLAVIVVVPGPTTVRVEPATVAALVLELPYEIGNPEAVVAVRANGAAAVVTVTFGWATA